MQNIFAQRNRTGCKMHRLSSVRGITRMNILRFIYVSFFCVLIAGCGVSKPDGFALFDKNMASTKEQFDAAKVKQATLTLFSQNFTEIWSNSLPPEVTSLPLFAGDVRDLHCYRATTNSLIFACGGAFGEWGLIVSQSDDSSVTNSLSHAVATPWSHGIFFWREL